MIIPVMLQLQIMLLPYIRNIGRVRKGLTKEATISLVRAFISSKVHHLNGLLYLLQKLQKIQNNAARIVTQEQEPRP